MTFCRRHILWDGQDPSGGDLRIGGQRCPGIRDESLWTDGKRSRIGVSKGLRRPFETFIVTPDVIGQYGRFVLNRRVMDASSCLSGAASAAVVREILRTFSLMWSADMSSEPTIGAWMMAIATKVTSDLESGFVVKGRLLDVGECHIPFVGGICRMLSSIY